MISNIVLAEGSLDDYIEIGDKYLSEQNYTEALFTYNEALNEFPKNSKILYRIANVYILRKQYDTSISFFKKIIKTDPEFESAYYDLGKIYYEKSKLDIPKKKYSEKKKIQEKYLKASYLYFERYLVKNKNNDSDAIFFLGDLYFKGNLFEKSYRVFSRDKNNDFRNNFGAALTGRFIGKYRNSKKYYERVLEEKPNFEEAYLGIAITYQLMGEFDKALRNFELYLAVKDDENVYVTMTSLYIEKKNYKKAKEVAEKGLNKFPNSKNLEKMMRKEIFPAIDR